MLMNIETELDRQGVTRMVTVAQPVTETVAVRPHATRAHLAVDASSWTWRELRDYVVTELEERFGPADHPADWAVREASIFKSFIARHGIELAVSIARYVIEVCDAQWQGRPITATSFCKKADPFMALPIADRIRH